jgi:predicted negative regulator of RcsB-dependent stress response
VSDYLTDEEQVARLKTWWDENGKSLVIGLVVVVVGVAGYRWYDGFHTEQNIAASDLYEEFLLSDGENREAALAKLADQASGTSYEVLALLQHAKSSVGSGEYEAAQATLRDAVAAAPDAILADVARLRLARVLQQLDRTDAALGVLGDIRSEGFRSSVAELQGDIHLLRGEPALAHEAYAAALSAAGDGVGRPMLQMKLADTGHATSGELSEEPDPDSEGVAAVDATTDESSNSEVAADAEVVPDA